VKNSSKDEVRYIWKMDEDDKSKWFEIKKDRRGYRKNPTKAENLNGFSKIGEYTWTNAIRKDSNLFDESKPVHLVKLQTFGSYNSSFIDCSGNIGTFSEKIADAALIRNNQRIGQFPIENFKASSARASPESFAKICLFQSELSYSVTCRQDNVLDKELGIQSNKNQINHESFPEPLARLLTHIKNADWDEVSTYFKSKISEYEEKVREANRLEEQAENARLAAEAAKKALETTSHSEEVLNNEVISETQPVNSSLTMVTIIEDSEHYEDASDGSEIHNDPEVSETQTLTLLGSEVQNQDDDESKAIKLLEADCQSDDDSCDEDNQLLAGRRAILNMHIKLNNELLESGFEPQEYLLSMNDNFETELKSFDEEESTITLDGELGQVTISNADLFN
jgi:hypothetical protein